MTSCPGSDDEWCLVHGDAPCDEVATENKLIGIGDLADRVKLERIREQQIIQNWYRAADIDSRTHK